MVRALNNNELSLRHFQSTFFPSADILDDLLGSCSPSITSVLWQFELNDEERDAGAGADGKAGGQGVVSVVRGGRGGNMSNMGPPQMGVSTVLTAQGLSEPPAGAGDDLPYCFMELSQLIAELHVRLRQVSKSVRKEASNGIADPLCPPEQARLLKRTTHAATVLENEYDQAVRVICVHRLCVTPSCPDTYTRTPPSIHGSQLSTSSCSG